MLPLDDPGIDEQLPHRGQARAGGGRAPKLGVPLVELRPRASDAALPGRAPKVSSTFERLVHPWKGSTFVALLPAMQAKGRSEKTRVFQLEGATS